MSGSEYFNNEDVWSIDHNSDPAYHVSQRSNSNSNVGFLSGEHQNISIFANPSPTKGFQRIRGSKAQLQSAFLELSHFTKRN